MRSETGTGSCPDSTGMGQRASDKADDGTGTGARAAGTGVATTATATAPAHGHATRSRFCQTCTIASAISLSLTSLSRSMRQQSAAENFHGASSGHCPGRNANIEDSLISIFEWPDQCHDSTTAAGPLLFTPSLQGHRLQHRARILHFPRSRRWFSGCHSCAHR